MDYELRPAAALEFEAALNYYEAQRLALGREFIDEFVRAVDHIRAFPDAAPLVSARSRRYRLKRFPYGLIYQVRNNVIRILVVMQLNRDPGYWRDRDE